MARRSGRRSRRRSRRSSRRSCSPGSKKFAKIVNGKCIRFGDPNMTIKKNQPGRKRSFCARHRCSQKRDKATAGYQSCKKWSCPGMHAHSRSRKRRRSRSKSPKRSFKRSYSRSKKRSPKKKKKSRCWRGYEPVPGKKPYSKGSCRKIRR